MSYSYASSMAGEDGDILYTINNTNTNYLSVSIAQQTARIRFRYYVNPAGMTFGVNDSYLVSLMRGTTHTDRTSRMYMGNVTSTFGLLPTSYTEGATGLVSQFVNVAKAEMYIEEEFQRSSGAGVNDAVYTVWVNGSQIYQRTGFINYTSFGLVNQCWFGGAAEIDAGTSGTFTFGKLIITNNDSLIGPYAPHNGQAFNQLRRRRRLSQ